MTTKMMGKTILKAAGIRTLSYLLASTTALAQMPEIEHQPESLTIEPGWRAGFTVKAIGDPPLSYQWYHNGNEIPGEGEDLLLLPTVQKAAAGAYSVKITNPLGSVTSEEAQLTVEEFSVETVDRSFRVAAPDMDVPESLHIVSGRRLILGGRFAVTQEGEIDTGLAGLHRLLPSGSFDLSWKPEIGYTEGELVSVIEQSENRVVLAGRVSASGDSNTTQSFLIRLLDDGTSDPSFTPPSFRIIPDLVFADGDRLIVGVGDGWKRLESSGAVDESYAGEVPEIFSGDPIIATFAGLDNERRLIVYGAGFVGTGYLWRLDQNGRLDPSFGVVEASFEGLPIQLEVHSDGSLLFGSEFGFRWSGLPVTYTISKLDASGAVDAGFILWSPDSDDSRWGYENRFAVQPDGKILVVGDFSRYGSHTCNQIARLNYDGSFDESFISVKGPDRQSSLSAVAIEESGQIAYIAREFYAFDDHETRNIARINLNSSAGLHSPRLLRARLIDKEPVPDGSDIEVEVIAVGTGPISIGHRRTRESDYPDKVAIVNIQDFTQDFEEEKRTIWVRSVGGEIYDFIEFSTTESKPIIVSPSPNLTVEPGRQLTLLVYAIGTSPRSYKWYHNDNLISEGEQYGSLFELLHGPLTSQDTGTYRLEIENALGKVEGTTILRVGPRSRLANLSTRAFVDTGERGLIIGFTIEGGGRRKTLNLRGLGPELSLYGVVAYLEDPIIELHHASGKVLWVVNNPDIPNLFGTGVFRLGLDSKSAAQVDSIRPGLYSLRVIGRNDTSGVVLGEIYDNDNRADRLVNLSSRALVGRGEKAAIPGFVIEGDAPLSVLVRAVGPGLEEFGVSQVLNDPTIRVFGSGSEPIATNDDWGGTAALESIFETVGAFPLGPESRDAALVLTLDPGAYTAVVSDTGNSDGIVLVEVYEVSSD